MAKVQTVLLNVMGAAIIALSIMVANYFFYDVTNTLEILFVLLLLAFDVISVISIFRASKLIKQQDEEKLKKSARLVKFGSIFFWITAFVVYKTTGLWGSGKTALIPLYTVLLGTSVFSIAYIRLLRKEKKLSLGQAVFLTLLQLFFVLDILAIALLACLEKSKKSAAEITRFFLGSYKPPEFLTSLAGAINRGVIKKVGAFFAGQWQNHRARFCLCLAVLC
ncbi:MAG: hypothetical protein LBI04_07930, partial [Treponema sp.]|nr:hypothetical protein [Treponema sp.]